MSSAAMLLAGTPRAAQPASSIRAHGMSVTDWKPLDRTARRCRLSGACGVKEEA
jgi:hypothetical protein